MIVAGGGEPVIVDARGRPCPIPVIELARAIGRVEVGAEVEVRADDPAADADIPAWCRLRAQEYVGPRPLADGSGTAYRVRRLN